MTPTDTPRSAFARFVALGMADARQRFARLTAHEPPNDSDVIDVVEASVVVRSVGRVVEAVVAASRTSVLLEMIDGVRRTWLHESPVDRTRLAGLALVSAAIVHLALVRWQGPTPGWLWLVVPALAVALGGLMVLAPARGLDREASR